MMARRELSMLAIDVMEKMMLLEEEERRMRDSCGGRHSLVSLSEPGLYASLLSASFHPVRRRCSSNAKFQVLLWIICPEHSSTYLLDSNPFEAAVALYDTSFTVWLICSHLEPEQSWRLPTTPFGTVRSVSVARALERVYH
jgi:hypothetical protein